MVTDDIVVPLIGKTCSVQLSFEERFLVNRAAQWGSGLCGKGWERGMEANAPQWHALGFLGGVWGLLEWQQQPAAHQQSQSITDEQIDFKVSELSADHVHRQLSMSVPQPVIPLSPLLPSLDFICFSASQPAVSLALGPSSVR